jgi:hypothetical protein
MVTRVRCVIEVRFVRRVLHGSCTGDSPALTYLGHCVSPTSRATMRAVNVDIREVLMTTIRARVLELDAHTLRSGNALELHLVSVAEHALDAALAREAELAASTRSRSTSSGPRSPSTR